MKYVGVKQVIKALENGDVSTVYVAQDAEKHVTEKLIKICIEKNVALKRVETMVELGKLAGIEVKSAAAAE